MSTGRRYYSLDFLKLILAILITMHHFQQLTGIDTGKLRFYGGFINFALCVEFFFIISGFLAAMKLQSIRETSFPEYLKKKVSRLYPLPVFSVLVILILDWILFLTGKEWLGNQTPDIFKVLNSFLISFASGVVDSGNGLNNPMWFVNVLMICYMILWMVMHLCRKNGWNYLYPVAAICALGRACLTYGTDMPFFNSSTSRGYCAFFLGITLYSLYEKANRKRLFIISSGVLLICTALVFVDYYSFYKYEDGALTFVVFPAVLFVALYLDRFRENRFLSHLGSVSFEIYVWHALGIYIYQLLFRQEHIANLTQSQAFITMLTFAAAVTAFAVVFHCLFEKKVVRMMTVMVNWLFEKEGKE